LLLLLESLTSDSIGKRKEEKKIVVDEAIHDMWVHRIKEKQRVF